MYVEEELERSYHSFSRVAEGRKRGKSFGPSPLPESPAFSVLKLDQLHVHTSRLFFIPLPLPALPAT